MIVPEFLLLRDGPYLGSDTGHIEELVLGVICSLAKFVPDSLLQMLKLYIRYSKLFSLHYITD